MATSATDTVVQPQEKGVEIPEWENAAVNTGSGAKAARSKRSFRLDSIMPAHKRYLGMSRKVLLIVLLAALLALLALIIGLAAGLSNKHSKHSDLPLPSNTQTFVGDFTYYGTGLGACGETSTDNDNIVSISHIVFDAAGSSSSTGGNSNANPLCGRMLRASRFDEEYGQTRSIDLKVVDRCTGCQPDDLDTSLGAFTQLAPQASGRVDITWAWLQPVQTGS
ncbi:hypothetical protein LTR78_008037 [Recurvomyces mirabilis]|uniref:RlpA-like protein double-psi beta-barrel domain-containing protein n=1 Tax=Recurvomyces mirabilis TaxID=574656 RepID=A0AAE0TQT5_9PEZI|nr:hypothetical protein LTR78_008037 [Recurvomyces mirabilis]KAK5150765.1 hypothetical protein LTS14_009828 [Recurvomyces mirabilis]